ncbi:MAG: maleylacetoacetate isomerase [Wenzhouxiangellaceae bacterium]|nr:maleylacetoacetate isomerase [Wenzhouxiangellaceae bacterium]
MTTEPTPASEPQPTEPLVLYGYWRSSSSYRVRMALNLKGIACEQRCVHLVRDGGQQHADDYLRLNPQAQVPTLVHGDRVLTQSLAILEYLEERFPETPALLPGDPAGRARVRALCNAIACDIHPLNNLRVLQYLTGTLGVDEQARLAWYRHWVAVGMDAVERMLAVSEATGTYCHGDEVTLADCCLLPQLYNARRYGCDESGWPVITRICAELAALDAVERALPENQADADGNL